MRTRLGKISTPATIAAALAFGAVPTIAMSAGSSTGSYENSYATKSAGGYTAAPAYAPAPATDTYTAVPAPVQPYVPAPASTYTVVPAPDTYAAPAQPYVPAPATDIYTAAPAPAQPYSADTGAAPAGNYISVGPYVGASQ